MGFNFGKREDLPNECVYFDDDLFVGERFISWKYA